jgi:hypothetical protein
MAADKNLESYAGEDGTLISNRVIAPDDWTQISDVLKFSNCTNVTVDGCTIEGGKEDCIDAVRGSDYIFHNLTLAPRKNGITLKGSIDNYLIEDVTFISSGSDCDMEFGQYDNYWYIGRKPTRNGRISFTKSVDGKQLVLKLWDAEMPVITDSDIKVVKIPKIIWWPYFVFRAIQTRGIKNIFKPVEAGTFIKTK